ncbi:uncharacterized protein PG986_000563 [Apiospora aurea]|uniref:Uncharacterized protein n=1 Tax=Apiospora aurea TaxID=335848 RepID=A0ABR1QVE0_9PEZI
MLMAVDVSVMVAAEGQLVGSEFGVAEAEQLLVLVTYTVAVVAAQVVPPAHAQAWPTCAEKSLKSAQGLAKSGNWVMSVTGDSEVPWQNSVAPWSAAFNTDRAHLFLQEQGMAAMAAMAAPPKELANSSRVKECFILANECQVDND